MAHSAAHHSVEAISRSDGRSAVAAAAYRHALQATDERTGTVHDYRRRRHVAAQGVVGWSGDVASLWNAAEAAENRKNSRTARESTIALPHELAPEEQERMATLHCLWLRKEFGLACSWAIHRNPGNHHLHIMETTRRVRDDVFGDKARELDDGKTGPENMERRREHWAEIVNRRLHIKGVPEKVDHRSLARRAEAGDGPQQEPMEHLGPAKHNVKKKWAREARKAKETNQPFPPAPRFLYEEHARRKRNAEVKALWQEWKATQKALAAAQAARVSAVETGTAPQAQPVPNRNREEAIARAVASYLGTQDTPRHPPSSQQAWPPPPLKPRPERQARQRTR